MADLPCDCNGVCMVCRAAPPPLAELLMCFTCFTLWHVPCLSELPSLAGALRWTCPDCPGDAATAAPPAPSAGDELLRRPDEEKNDAGNGALKVATPGGHAPT